MIKGNSDISYQNKDIISKIFGEQLKEKSFETYGIHLPPIEEVIPTNLPDIVVNEQHIDNIFRLSDGSYAIVDYESDYSDENILKYLGYVRRSIKRLMNDGYRLDALVIRMIVIYTADEERSNTKSIIDIGSVRVNIEEGFLSEIDGESIKDKIESKINNNCKRYYIS